VLVVIRCDVLYRKRSVGDAEAVSRQAGVTKAGATISMIDVDLIAFTPRSDDVDPFTSKLVE
jgi:hypothetical protein